MRCCPRELLKKIRRIEIVTEPAASNADSGAQYHSVFKGRGMAFAEVRQYIPGDDIRFIDWNVTARMNEAVRQAVRRGARDDRAAARRHVGLAGASARGSATKRELPPRSRRVLAFSAIKNNDRVGALIFTDRVERFVPPRKGLDHALAIVRDALALTPAGRATGMDLALRSAASLLKQRAVVFVVSDFLDAGFEKALRMLNRRHDVVALPITDPREEEMPRSGLVRLRDAESGATCVVDLADPAFRATWGRRAGSRFPDPARIFRSAGIDSIPLRTDAPFEAALVRFFKERERRKAAGR